MDLKLNANRFTGNEYVNLYNQYRPEPPLDLLHQSLNYTNQSAGLKVVDIGCGTGISTRVWSAYAAEITGIDPSAEMLKIAQELSQGSNIKYLEGYSNATNLATHSVDLVTCSQSFHWMEPKSTLIEIERILKKEGVLVIYDVIWPPSMNCLYENAYNSLFEKVKNLTSDLEETIAFAWDKKEHLKNIRDSHLFRYTKEAYYHKTVPADKEKLIGIALSQGGLEALRKRGYTENEIGITEFKEKIEALEGLLYDSMTYHYRVIYAIK